MPTTTSSHPLVSSRTSYMSQLDALRAFAVMSVIFFHFLQFGQETTIPLGFMGVTSFFVLSGFLITGILLKCRDNVKAGASRKDQLKIFYMRRFLRIFPLYYAVVIVGTLLGLREMQDSFAWNVTYTSNLYYALKQHWGGPDSHFWTLAVEEQFYMLWPLLILLLPDKFLLPCIVVSWLSAIVFRGCIYGLGWNQFLGFLTLARLDGLAVGALLAFFQYRKPEQFQTITRNRSYNGLGAALFLVFLAASWMYFVHPVMGLVQSAIFPFFAFWFIHRAAVGFTGATGRLLENKMLSDCGKISYGLYVFHPFVRELLPEVLQKFHIPPTDNNGLDSCLQIGVSIAIATLSWLLLEKPLNNLKRHFPYVSGAKKSATSDLRSLPESQPSLAK